MSLTEEEMGKHLELCEECEVFCCTKFELVYCGVCEDDYNFLLCLDCIGVQDLHPTKIKRICNHCWDVLNRDEDDVIRQESITMQGPSKPYEVPICCARCKQESQIKLPFTEKDSTEEKLLCVLCYQLESVFKSIDSKM